MKIRDRLIIGFSVVIFLVIIIGVVTLIQTAQIEHEFHVVEKETTPAIVAMGKLESNIFLVTLEANEYILDPVGEHLEELQEGKAKLGEAILAHEKAEEEEEHAVQLKQEITKIISLVDEIINLKDSGASMDILHEKSKMLDEIVEEFSHELEEEIEHDALQLAESHQAVDDQIQTTNNFIIIIIVITVILSIVIAWIFATSVSNPIRKLDDAARKVTNGDLDIQTNITQNWEIKSLGESFDKMVASLKELDEKKREFTIMISHELKTPLFPIKGYTEMLKDPGSGGKLTNEKLEYVNEIDNNISKLEALIGDLLIFQKLDKGELDFSKEKFSVGEFVTQLSKDYSVRSEKQIQYVINPTEEITLETDKKLLRRALDHLITNAMDFVPENNGKIEVGIHQDGENVVFYVKDNGIGISKREFENIFKKFYQVDAGDARAHGGMGTGLTICKGIIEGLGGKIWVESEEGKGSTFFFTIPKAG